MLASQEDIDRCQFGEWFHTFKDVSIKSRVFPLPALFMEYLAEDGVFVPIASSLDQDQLSDDEECKSVSSEQRKEYHFPELEQCITEAIAALGGQVFVKLNWSAPLDAIWINAGSMKCVNAHDVFLLLKSSERIVFDMERMYELLPDATVTGPSQPTLVLRKWCNLHPSMEFRAFVCNGLLLGICQRNCTTFFPFLADELQGPLLQAMRAFYQDVLLPRAPLQSYTVDLYVDQSLRVWLLDLNPFGLPTCALLFDWEEFEAFNELQVRTVLSEGDTLQSTAGSSRGPVDVHLAADFPRFLDICRQQQQQQGAEDNDSDGDEPS